MKKDTCNFCPHETHFGDGQASDNKINYRCCIILELESSLYQ